MGVYIWKILCKKGNINSDCNTEIEGVISGDSYEIIKLTLNDFYHNNDAEELKSLINYYYGGEFESDLRKELEDKFEESFDFDINDLKCSYEMKFHGFYRDDSSFRVTCDLIFN